MFYADVAEKAKWYLERGYNPLPSRPIGRRIRPSLTRYGNLKKRQIPSVFLEKWWTPGIQVCLGEMWDLCVVDLDGPDGRKWWRERSLVHGLVKTWAVRHDPNGGLHLWFRWPGEALPFKTWIWQGDGKHQAVELLGEGNLIVAPPTVSPKSGNQYAWVPGFSPDDIERPACLPGWVLDIVAEQRAEKAKQRQLVPAVPSRVAGVVCGASKEEVDEAIRASDSVWLAKAIGLRVASDAPNSSGWVSVHSAFREDRNPSASFTARHGGGVYWESGQEAMNAYDLLVKTGRVSCWKEALGYLASILGVSSRERGKRSEAC